MIEMAAGTVNVAVGGDTMPVYVSAPTHETQRAVVVVQEAFGVTDHIRDVADRLATQGYVAVAPHLFHRSGAPELGYEEPRLTVPHLQRLDREEIEADLDAVLDQLEARAIAPARTAVLGFCMGGSISLLAGCTRELGAAITFYGGGISTGRFGMPPLLDLAPELRSPWLGLYGDLDETIPTHEVEDLRTALATSGPPSAILRYPDAGHGFFCDQRPSYHQLSATDAWNATLTFLRTHLEGEGRSARLHPASHGIASTA
jgi:carboxymethylenebutenolidase